MTILWDAPTDPTIVGFSVVYGTQSGAYSQRVNVGVQTSATIGNLSDGVTYYFAVRSVSDGQAMSTVSNEVEYAVPRQSQVITALALTSTQSSPQVLGTTVLWTAVAGGGTVSNQYRWSVSDGTSVVRLSDWSPASSFAWKPTAVNPGYSLIVSARAGGDGVTAMTQAMPFAIVPVGSLLGASAKFTTIDVATQGNWIKKFYQNSALLAAESMTLPPSVSVANSGASSWTWVDATSDLRALQRPSGPSRFAATWFSASSFDIDVNVLDGASHSVALYLVDWDSFGARRERIDVINAASQNLLDSKTVTGFSNGQYLAWTVTGHVTFRITRLSGSNAVVSGVFLDGRIPSPPAVTLDSPAPRTNYLAPATIALHATATDVDGISQVEFFAGPVSIAKVTTLPYAATAVQMPAGSYLITAVATDTFGATATSDPVAVTVSAVAAAARFVADDTATQGAWLGRYGHDGAVLAQESSALVPAYAQFLLANQNAWTWTDATTAPGALQRPSGASRFAATWYSAGAFLADVNLSDGKAHQVALYVVDWLGNNQRAETIEVVDAVSQRVLDAKTVTHFGDGNYLVWTVTGHVTFRITNSGVPNAVVSGVFFDPPVVMID
jgi:hypothetical protein